MSNEIAGLDEVIDDLAGLCKHWARNRDKGRTPRIIRDAIIQVCQLIHPKPAQETKACTCHPLRVLDHFEGCPAQETSAVLPPEERDAIDEMEEDDHNSWLNNR